MGVSHFDGSNKTGTRYPFRSRGTVPGMLEHPTDREKKKNTHTHTSSTRTEKEILPTIHQRTQGDDIYEYPATRVSS